jgi:2-polyprenyl-3-methyl-5-hydroxy-6-metoxy-1,4-benzoquinol methylase
MKVQTKIDSEIERYLSGDQLYGDNLTLPEIEAWYADEGEGYANLGSLNKSSYRYAYHALNWRHGFSKVNLNPGLNILGFGSAYGEELKPVLAKARNITIIDPSDVFVSKAIGGIPCSYVKPIASGKLEFQNSTFDLVTAFGVLHHIPNVSTVLREISRVMKPGATLLLREPIVSMGGWRFPRPGLTRHERGIPIKLLRELVLASGLKIQSEELCVFPPLTTVLRKIQPEVYNNSLLTAIDQILSRIFSFNVSYHAFSWWQKIRPSAVFFVIEKPENVDKEMRAAL